MRLHKGFATAAVGVSWGGLVVIGFLYAARHELTPAQPGTPAPGWPAASQLTHAPDRPTLLMFLHPHCPCSRASLAELEKVLAHGGGRVMAQVVFVIPEGMSIRPEETALWTRAAAIPHVIVRIDRDGTEANRFGVESSGHVLIFEPGGRRQYSGGITGSRGHVSDNPGGTAAAALLRGERTNRSKSPVFGCPLFNPTL